MRCDRAEAASSERMDGERLARRVEEALQVHLDGCPACRGFVDGAQAVRERVRIRVAEPVPDLVEQIMERVAAEPAPRRLRRHSPAPVDEPWHVVPARRHGLLRRRSPAPAPRARPARLRRELARLALALLAGALVGGSLVSSGPGPIGPAPPPVLAADISERVTRAAAALTSFHARYELTERNFAPEVPLRRFTLEVWFSAPERFRLDVLDHSAYPDPAWPGNDVTLVVNGPRSYTSGPGPCARAEFPDCPLSAPTVRRVDHRVPFSSSAPLLGDLVVPLETLSTAGAATVVGRDTVLGREAMIVALPLSRATPLLSFLRQGGAWRPLHPDDRVELWLDESSWFPLRYRVLPADTPERRAWAARNHLPLEPPDRAILEAGVIALQERIPYPGLFTVPRATSANQGAKSVSLADLPQRVGFEPALPQDTRGMALYRAVVPAAGEDGAREAVLTFTSGLAWVKVKQTDGWREAAPYGGVSPFAEQVELSSGGVGLFEPADGTRPRRVSLQGSDLAVTVEGNVGRADLLEVAGSIAVGPAMRSGNQSFLGGGNPQADAASGAEGADYAYAVNGLSGGLRRLSLPQARRAVAFDVDVPEHLPAGYSLSSAELASLRGTESLTLHFHHDSLDATGAIRLHLEAADELPPASSARQLALEVPGVAARYTPSRHRLEWVVDGLYRSLDAPGLDLAGLVAIADSIPGSGFDPLEPTATVPVEPSTAPSDGGGGALPRSPPPAGSAVQEDADAEPPRSSGGAPVDAGEEEAP